MAFESERRRASALVDGAKGTVRLIHDAAASSVAGVRDARARLRNVADDFDRTPRPAWMSAVVRAVSAALAGLQRIFIWLSGRLAHSWPARFVTQNLTRRIVASNLIGFLLLIGGLLYLSQKHPWLIEAKSNSLKEQGEIIARVIASNATIENERIAIDPDRLPEIEGARIPFRSDAFAALELSIRPERITPLLRRLMQQTNNRARIYGRDGTLIVDTAMFLSKGQVLQPPVNTEGRAKTRNFWTRLTQWLKGSDLSVYREIGTANGLAYPEVRDAIGAARSRDMLLLTEEGELMVSVTVPIQRAGAVHGALLLSTRPGEIDEIVADERNAILTLAAVALLGMIAAALMLARTVAGPMTRLSAAAEHASTNIRAARELPTFPDRKDEIGQMATAFRSMTGALYRRIEASEKFAADVSHELKNPLTAARSTAESLGYAKSDEQRHHLVTQIQGELKRLNRLITDVSNASRLDAELALQQSEPVDVSAILGGIVATFQDLLADGSKRIVLVIGRREGRDTFVVGGNEGRLAQVITNLVDNAISFSPEAGCITVEVTRAGGRIEFSVRDQGPGIDEENLEKVFERFYTYRPTAESSRGNNSGLGLSISREILAAHGGQIWAENLYDGTGADARKRVGAVFKVSLPAAAAGRR